MLSFILFNLVCNLGAGKIYAESLVLALTNYFSVGLFEEVIVRAILIGHMMHHWKNDVHRIRKTVFWSSVIFGVLHIGNIFTNPLSTLFQIFYATGLGILLAAVYLRTRNLWSCILFHALNDFCADIRTIFVPLQADLAAYHADLAEVPQVILEQIPEETLISIVPILQLMILPLTIFVTIAGLYMLRPGKSRQINKLWAQM